MTRLTVKPCQISRNCRIKFDPLHSPSRAIFQDSTFGQKESASKDEKHGEKTASTIDGQLDIASGLL